VDDSTNDWLMVAMPDVFASDQREVCETLQLEIGNG
jgi:hypothetical protein